MLQNRQSDFSKVRKIYSRKQNTAECKKQAKYIEMKELLSNIY